MMLGADTAPVEVNPNPDKLVSLPIHQLALVVHGVNTTNLRFDLESVSATSCLDVSSKQTSGRAGSCGRV
jgi:hypothetical protein